MLSFATLRLSSGATCPKMARVYDHSHPSICGDIDVQYVWGPLFYGSEDWALHRYKIRGYSKCHDLDPSYDNPGP